MIIQRVRSVGVVMYAALTLIMMTGLLLVGAGRTYGAQVNNGCTGYLFVR